MVSGDDRILVARRKPDGHLPLLWEFPGGKLEWGESPESCLAREFKEELAVDVAVGRVLDVVFHRYPERQVLLLFFGCAIVAGEPMALDCAEIAWVRRSELGSLDWVPADLTFVRKLAASGDPRPGLLQDC